MRHVEGAGVVRPVARVRPRRLPRASAAPASLAALGAAHRQALGLRSAPGWGCGSPWGGDGGAHGSRTRRWGRADRSWRRLCRTRLGPAGNGSTCRAENQGGDRRDARDLEPNEALANEGVGEPERCTPSRASAGRVPRGERRGGHREAPCCGRRGAGCQTRRGPSRARRTVHRRCAAVHHRQGGRHRAGTGQGLGRRGGGLGALAGGGSQRQSMLRRLTGTSGPLAARREASSAARTQRPGGSQCRPRGGGPRRAARRGRGPGRHRHSAPGPGSVGGGPPYPLLIAPPERVGSAPGGGAWPAPALRRERSPGRAPGRRPRGPGGRGPRAAARDRGGCASGRCPA